jgi:tRNA G18 (ribose-2'-O)-methylase SpoU
VTDSQLIWEAYHPGPDEGLDTIWCSEDGKQVLTIKEVLSYLDKASVPVKNVQVDKLKSIIIPPKNPERIEAAKLHHPIIVTVNLEGEYQSILDGNHRLQKAMDADEQTMKVRELDLRTAPEMYKQLLNYEIRKWVGVPYRSYSGE